METGQYFEGNQTMLRKLSDDDWRIALKKCKEHLGWKLKGKTRSGVHSSSQLGAETTEHYIGEAYEKLLLGEWEWQEKYSLSQQMIRIIDSSLSKSVKKSTTNKAESLKITSEDIETTFYYIGDTPATPEEINTYEEKIKLIEEAINGDEQLGFLFEAVKEGRKRAEIAELLGVNVRQFDKLRDKLIEKTRKIL